LNPEQVCEIKAFVASMVDPCKKSFLPIDCRKLAAILSLLQQDGHLCLLQVKDATGNLLHARYFFKIAKSACHKSDQPRKNKDMMKNLNFANILP